MSAPLTSIQQRQVVQGIVDEGALLVAAAVPGDLRRTREDHHLVHKRLHQHAPKAVAHRHRLVAALVADQGC